jgi:hypothetical protein
MAVKLSILDIATVSCFVLYIVLHLFFSKTSYANNQLLNTGLILLILAGIGLFAWNYAVSNKSLSMILILIAGIFYGVVTYCNQNAACASLEANARRSK